MSLVAISGNASGTGTLTIAAPNTNSNYTLTLPELTGTVLTNKTAGTVLQVVSATKTDTFSTTVEDTVFVDITGLSASITPTSATNTILVLASIGKCSCTTSSRSVNFRLDRNGTSIALGDTAGNRVRISFCSSVATSEQGLSASLNFIDSPASTSALTYKIQMSGHNGEATVINRNGNNTDNNDAPAARSISTLILMEIAA